MDGNQVREGTDQQAGSSTQFITPGVHQMTEACAEAITTGKRVVIEVGIADPGPDLPEIETVLEFVHAV